MTPESPYYRQHLALVHHLGFAAHADACAPGILTLLEPVRARQGVVLELGCGSGLLTRHSSTRVTAWIATDASPAMLDLARQHASGVEDIRELVLPEDPIPPADAIVSVGHVLSYLPDEEAIDRAFTVIADALAPHGVLAVDICDLEWGEARRDAAAHGRVGDDWATSPSSRCRHRIASYVRWPCSRVTTLVPGTETTNATTTCSSTPAGSRTPCEPRRRGAIGDRFGDNTLPTGLRTVIGTR